MTHYRYRKFCFLIIVAIGFSLLFPSLVEAQTSPVTEAQLASVATRLTQMNYDGRPLTSSKLQEMIQLAQKRHDLMFQVIQENPSMAQRYVGLAGVRNVFPPEVKALIEEKKTLTGEIEIIYAENFTTSLIQQRYFIDTANYGVVELFSDSEMPDSITGSGSSVSVDAYLLDTVALLAPADKGTTISSRSRTLPATPPLVGQKKLAVIMFKFDDQRDTAWPASVDQIRQSTFVNQDSLAAYYKETSFGKFTVTGDVFGPYLATDVAAYDPLGGQTAMKCDDSITNRYKKFVKTFRRLGQGVIDGVAKTNPAIKNYDYYLFVTPEVCKLTEGFAVENTNMAFIDGLYNGVAATHEFGHLLGLGHANGLHCTSGVSGLYDSVGSTCVVRNYEDPFSIMGRPESEKNFNFFGSGVVSSWEEVRQINNFHKAQLGWLDRSSTRTITTNGVYDITPSNVQPSATPIYRIPIIVGDYIADARVLKPPLFYYLEYRIATGHFDNFLRDDIAVSGVSLRLVGDYDSVSNPMFRITLMVDVTPLTGLGLDDAFIGVGNSFRDERRKIKIEVLSADRNAARVKVTFNSEPENPGNNSQSSLLPRLQIIAPSVDGQSLSGSAPLTATFSPPTNGYIKEVKLSIDNSVAWTSQNNPGRPISPLTRNLSTWLLSTGPHKIKFTVTASNFQTASAERPINIVPDTTPPLVEITAPPKLTNDVLSQTLPLVYGNVTISARAKDQSGISSFIICANNHCSATPTCPTTTGSDYVACSVNFPLSYFVNQTVKVLAIAYDRAYDPNRGTAGLDFPPPVTIRADGANSGTVVFGPWRE